MKEGERGTHSVLDRIDGTRGASDEGTSELFGGLPNNLSEVRVGGILGVIIHDLPSPHIDTVGDGERIGSDGQVL